MDISDMEEILYIIFVQKQREEKTFTICPSQEISFDETCPVERT